MIQLPVQSNPCLSFSVNTVIGTIRFRTYWQPLLNTWFMDILGSDETDWLDGIALTTGSNNLIAGNNIPQLNGCAIFVVDPSGNGNQSFSGFGETAFVFMTFPGDTPILPYSV